LGNTSNRARNTLAIWLLVGAAIGAGIGVALDNVAMGAAMDAGVGVALGAGLSRRRNR
jgi:hypothetical protein